MSNFIVSKNLLSAMEKITNQQAYEETLQYFKGDDLAARVWVTKYALKDSDGNIYEKTPDDMHHRIASAQMSNKLENDLVLPLVSGVKYSPKHLFASFVIFKYKNAIFINKF